MILSLKLIKKRVKFMYTYSGIPIFRTSKGNENWFEKSGVPKIDGGIKLYLFYRGIVL